MLCFPGHGNFLLMQRLQGFRVLLLQDILFLLSFLHAVQQLFQLRLPAGQLLGQFLQLPFPGKQVHVPGGNRSARHGAAGVHYVSLQGHQPEGVPAPAHDGDSRVQVFRDHRPAQQVLHHAPEVSVAFHQFRRHAQASGHIQHFPLPRIQHPGLHGGNGQKGRPAQMVPPQVFDQLLRGFLILRDNILLCRAQHHIQRRFIDLRHLNQLAQHAVHTFHPAVPGLLHGGADRMGIALHLPAHLRQQLPAGFHIPHFRQLPVILLPGLNHFPVRPVQPVHAFLPGVRPFLLQGLFLPKHGSGGLYAAILLRRLAPHLLAGHRQLLQAALHRGKHRFQPGLVVQRRRMPVHGFHDGILLCFQGFLPRVFLRPGLRLRRLCRGQRVFLLFDQPLSGLAAAFAVRGKLRQLLQPPGRCGGLLLNPPAGFPAVVSAFLHPPAGVLRLMQGFHPFHGRLVRAGNLLFQRGDFRLQRIPLIRLFLQRDFRLLQHGVHALQIAVQLPQLRFHPVAAHLEQVQVQRLQLSAQLQVYSRIFGFFLQRLQPALQLFQNVIHPGQVILGVRQLPVRFFLSRPELDNACRFLENQAPVLSLAGKDLVYPSLPDDGVAFLADSGVPEQIHHILQPAGRAVQKVFALP